MKREWKPYRIVRAEAICGERSGPRSGRSAFSKNRPSETRQTPDVDVWRWWCARHDDTTTRAPLYTMCPRTLLWCAHPFQTFICMNIRYQESLRNTYTHVQTQIVRTHILLLVLLYSLWLWGWFCVCVCVMMGDGGAGGVRGGKTMTEATWCYPSFQYEQWMFVGYSSEYIEAGRRRTLIHTCTNSQQTLKRIRWMNTITHIGVRLFG